MINEEKCKHYDKENGWCKKLSDWSDPMPTIVCCPKSPCEHAEPIEQPMNDNDIIKAFDILDKFEFFGGRRVGRLLWFNKPADIQEKDIGGFNRDIDFLKAFINRQKAEIEQWKEEANKYQNLWCQAVMDVQAAKSEAIKEFAESVKKNRRAILNAIYDRTEYSNIVDNLVKEMTEEKE